MWRGSLLPLECKALPKPVRTVRLMHLGRLVWGRWAAQREQAPSPQMFASALENIR